MNIAEYIAYLIGDSRRLVIPPYEGIAHKVTLTSPSVSVAYNLPNALINDIEHPNGVHGIVGQGLAATLLPTGDWVGSLSMLENGKTYQILYTVPEELSLAGEDSVETLVYGPRDINTAWEASQIPFEILNLWVKASIRRVSKLLPSSLKLHMIGSKIFTAGELDSNPNGSNGSATIPLATIESDSILSVLRYDGETAYDCRRIPAHLKSKSRVGSGFLEECSETDPVFFVDGNKRIVVLPSPEETGLNSLDGFCQIDYIKYPDVDVRDDIILELPADTQDVVFLGAAIQCKEFEISSMTTPSSPEINPNFSPVNLGIEGLENSLQKAQTIIDGSFNNMWNDNTFKDFIENEDIEMAATSLKGVAAEISLASAQIAEQDKRAGGYLSEYSQNISKFSNDVTKYVARYKKLNADLDSLKESYHIELYAFRGELPSKKQLGESDKKLEAIKQVVQRK